MYLHTLKETNEKIKTKKNDFSLVSDVDVNNTFVIYFFLTRYCGGKSGTCLFRHLSSIAPFSK